MKVIVMVLVVALISGIFLWFVFSQRSTNIEEQVVDTAIEYDFSIDGEATDYVEPSDVEGDYVSATELENDRDNIDAVIEPSSQDSKASVQSPDTGAGEVAAVVAIIVATIFSVVIYKKIGKNIT